MYNASYPFAHEIPGQQTRVGRPRKFDHEKSIAFYVDNHNLLETAQKFGVSVTGIYQCLKANGIERHQLGRKKGVRVPNSRTDHAEILEEFERGDTLETIGKRRKLTRERIRQICKAEGAPVRRVSIRERAKTKKAEKEAVKLKSKLQNKTARQEKLKSLAKWCDSASRDQLIERFGKTWSVRVSILRRTSGTNIRYRFDERPNSCKIIDEFTDIDAPSSTKRLWRLKRDGKCTRCGGERDGDQCDCSTCRPKYAASRRKYYMKKRNHRP